jgi:hypothetical protein
MAPDTLAPGGGALALARYRFGPTLRRRRGGFVTLAVLLALVGGLALATIAGARRTESSYPTFLASTNPSNLSLGTALYNPALGYTTGYDGAIIKRIAALPGVTRVASYSGIDAVPLASDGKPNPAVANSNLVFNVFGSVDGLYFNMDRVSVVAGRMADPSNPHEIMATASAARAVGLHLGQRVPWGLYTNAQSGAFTGNSFPAPAARTNLTLVGIVDFNNAVIQDDADVPNDTSIVATPAFARQFRDCCGGYTFTFLQLRHGAATVPSVEREVEGVIPPNLPYDFYDPTIETTKALHSIKPEAIALGVFGLVAALATLLIAVQLIGRQLRSWTPEERVLRSLGANRSMIMLDALAGVIGSIVVGAIGACVVAVVLSPLFPLGPVRAVYPDRGFSFDWSVLGLGALALIVLLGLGAGILAWRAAPHHASAGFRAATPSSKVADAAAGWGMPVPAVTGMRFALEPGSEATPVRSAILGATLALVVVVSTVVFGSSLNALIARPALYGWNWSYQLDAGGGVGDLPGAAADRLLAADHQVSSWSSYYFGNLQIDGRTVPVLGATPGEAVGPPVLSGHGLEGTGQIVLGPETLGELHKKVGDTVEVAYGATRPEALRIVGTETMPAIGVAGVTGHLSIGTGAEADYHLIPASVRNSFNNVPAGPNSVFVRLKPGTDVTVAQRGLARIASELGRPMNYGVTLVGVQRPAEIVNYRSMGSTPAILGLALASGAVVALGLTLVASVRRRRRELAMLKTIGLTGRQLAGCVAWQAGVAVGVGVVVGIPLGIVVGRWFWTFFAEQIYAIPQPAVSVGWMAVIGAAALVLAMLVAFVPGRIAARTPAALMLRTE